MARKNQKITRDELMALINNKHGEGTIVLASDIKDPGWFPTGIFPLDFHLFGGKGITKGQQYMFWGDPGIGKSSVAHIIAAQAQKLYPEKDVAILNAEGKWALEFADLFKIDPNRTIVHKSLDMEETSDVLRSLLVDPNTKKPSDLLSVIIVDSVAALMPKSELDKPESEIRGSEQAKMLSILERKIARSLGDAIIIWINQVRIDQTPMPGGGPSGRKVPPSGWALRHACAANLQMSRVATLYDGTGETRDNFGWRVGVKATKNQTTRGWEGDTCYFNVVRGKGIDEEASIIEAAEHLGIVRRSGAWYEVGGEKYQGMSNLATALSENEELKERMKVECLEAKYGKMLEESSSE